MRSAIAGAGADGRGGGFAEPLAAGRAWSITLERDGRLQEFVSARSVYVEWGALTSLKALSSASHWRTPHIFSGRMVLPHRRKRRFGCPSDNHTQAGRGGAERAARSGR